MLPLFGLYSAYLIANMCSFLVSQVVVVMLTPLTKNIAMLLHMKWRDPMLLELFEAFVEGREMAEKLWCDVMLVHQSRQDHLADA